MNTETNPATPAAAMTAAPVVLTQEQKVAKLSEYDFILVIDKSGSMGECNKGTSGPTRWEYAQESTIAMAREICKIDADGIGLVLFSGGSIVSLDNCTVDKVKEAFAANRPGGSTPLAEALTAALTLGHKSSKNLFILVLTDGVPDSKEAAAKVIIDQANSQDTDEACTFLFVQVGADAQATKYLKMLDDDLTGAKFDIVDAKTIDEADGFASIADLVLNAIAD